jgi:hypothetical protein
MLVGPQFVLGGPNAGQPAFDRQGNRLNFTVDSPIISATEGNGVRISSGRLILLKAAEMPAMTLPSSAIRMSCSPKPKP